MKIIDILQPDRITLSFEVFPPKTSENYASVEKATSEIAKLKPDFMSVTYGAGGGTSAHTIDIASNLKDKYHVTALAHLSCVSSTKDEIRLLLDQMEERGIENILALRGDIPENMDFPAPKQYRYASELVREIKARNRFCIGAACYPEGHPKSANKKEDILHLKEKVDAGVDFITTQMFFDNNILYNFLYRIREIGITVPVCAGIMPVTNGKQISRICRLSGTELPPRFKAIADRFGGNPDAMRQAGIAYACDQIIDLIANGVTHIHVYSMNQPKVAAAIMNNLSCILTDHS